MIRIEGTKEEIEAAMEFIVQHRLCLYYNSKPHGTVCCEAASRAACMERMEIVIVEPKGEG